MRHRFTILSIAFAALFIPSGAEALTVSPPVIETEIAAGASWTRTIRIYNETEKDVRVHVERADTALTASETVSFVPPVPGGEKLSSWLEQPLGFSLAAGAWTDVPLAIRVPEHASPGSYGAALLFTPIPEGLDGSVGIIGKIAVVVIATVPGTITIDGRLLGFGLAEKASLNDTIFDHVPRGYRFKVHNAGNALVVPQGLIVVRDWLGRHLFELAVNEDARRVLPDWQRTFETKIENIRGLRGEWQPFALGRVTAKLELRLGDQVIRDELHFWIVPWRTLGLAAVGLLGIAVVPRIIRRRSSL